MKWLRRMLRIKPAAQPFRPSVSPSEADARALERKRQGLTYQPANGWATDRQQQRKN